MDSNYVETVIPLPPNLFFGTTVAKIDRLRADIEAVVVEIEE